MQHFFVIPEQVKAKEIIIEGTDVNHIKNVLRMKLGEELKVSDGNNISYHCKIAKMDEENVVVDIIEKHLADTELSTKIYLFQGLPKNDKMELIVQKAVELGVYQVIPVSTKRAIVKLDEKKAAKKVMRWNAIAESGAKQSGRSQIPKVTDVMSFEEAIQYVESQQIEHKLIPYELAEGITRTKEVIGQIQKEQSVGIFIGPEGGFEKSEVEQALTHGFEEITLGRRILRTETAGLALLSILMYQLEM